MFPSARASSRPCVARRRASSLRPWYAATSATPRNPQEGKDLGPLPAVAFDGLLGDATRFVHAASETEQTGQLHEVERVIPADPGFGPDDVLRHLDRPVELIGMPGEAEGIAVRVLPFP